MLLIRETGFDRAVDVWIEGLPEGGQSPSPKGRFRADQFLGVSADGDNIIIPYSIFARKFPRT